MQDMYCAEASSHNSWQSFVFIFISSCDVTVNCHNRYINFLVRNCSAFITYYSWGCSSGNLWNLSFNLFNYLLDLCHQPGRATSSSSDWRCSSCGWRWVSGTNGEPGYKIRQPHPRPQGNGHSVPFVIVGFDHFTVSPVSSTSLSDVDKVWYWLLFLFCSTLPLEGHKIKLF